jgi:hypothetical protein
MYQQLLCLDFGITAYATNVYLKACPWALQQLRAGARKVAMAARRQGQQQVSGAAAGTMAACGALMSCARLCRFGAAFTTLGGGLPGCERTWVCRPARQVRLSTCWPCRQARWANLPACLAAGGGPGGSAGPAGAQRPGRGSVPPAGRRQAAASQGAQRVRARSAAQQPAGAACRAAPHLPGAGAAGGGGHQGG